MTTSTWTSSTTTTEAATTIMASALPTGSRSRSESSSPRMDDSNLDVLGMAYEEFGMQNDAFGQHFTPHSAAAGMAEMLTTGEEPDPPVTIADPACGSGRMLVLAARQHDVPTICVGQDEDPLCRLNESDIDRSAAPSDATAPSYQ